MTKDERRLMLHRSNIIRPIECLCSPYTHFHPLFLTFHSLNVHGLAESCTIANTLETRFLQANRRLAADLLLAENGFLIKVMRRE